ncbi:exodeoxyribonuclease V subunit gamma [soil metagenome]
MLHLHTAERVGPLAARLAEVLHAPPADAFAPEWIAVPSEGMRRWLSLELARHLGASAPGGGDGVAANIETAFPGSLRTRVLAAGRPEGVEDPWDVERLAWAVLEELHGAAADPLLGPLVVGASGSSRYSRSRRIADLFDRYHVHRPGMVRAWAAGDDEDGTGRALTTAGDGSPHLWQPHLWRRVRAHVGQPSPPERLPELLDRLRAGDLELDLPERLSLFGANVLPGGAGFLDLAEAVAAHRDLHVFLLDPSPPTSALVAAATGPLAPGDLRMRATDRSADLVGHPLLRSWGRLPRETAVLLADGRSRGLPSIESLPSEPPGNATVLARLQAAIRSGGGPAAPEPVGAEDRSVQFHATHGPARQVDVARDAILHLLAEDPTLTEDDVVVLCPALDRFAPLVEAAFGPTVEAGLHASQHPPALRYRIADRSVRGANPMVAGFEAVLDAATGRCDATTILDLLAQPAIRRRYGLDDDEQARIGEWVAETQVRWGLDPEHRAPLGVPASITTNTWQAALDRLLLGAAVADDDLGFSLGGVVPFGIEGEDVDLAGRLADLLGHLGRLADAVASSRPLVGWVDLLRDAVASLLAPDPDLAWQGDALHQALAEIVDHATGRAGTTDLDLDLVDLRRLLGDRLGGRRGRPDFFRGGITVTSLEPLRAIPFRVVCLLGLDQPAFASGAASNDDLVAAAPAVGDRDPRAEVRQALLDAVLSAQDFLVVVRDGHDLRTNQEVPPAVVAAELLEAVAAAGGAPAAREVVHPRQPFDERAFGGERPWSFDPGALDGAVARRHRTLELRPFLADPLPEAEAQVIELADLRRFLDHPIQWFLERRLELSLPRAEDAVATSLPVILEGLDKWRVGDRLLTALLAEGDLDRWERLERQLGTLPPGTLGQAKAVELLAVVEVLVAAARDRHVRTGPPDLLDVDVVLADGTRVVGAVAGRLGGPQPGPALVGFSTAKPKYQLSVWLDLVALAADDPSTDWRAVAIHKPGGSAKTVVPVVHDLVVAGLPEDREAHARAGLEVAVELFRRGQREPLPLFPTLSEALHLDEAKPTLWDNRRRFDDRTDRFVAVAFGHLSYEELLALPAAPGDPPGSGGRAARYARHLWGAVERSTDARTTDREGGPTLEAVSGARS